MKSIIPIVNQLQIVFNALEEHQAELHSQLSTSNLPSLLDLPRVAVVGSQSVGKSSILEGIIGKPCLPRGLGLVTRCPLILQLHHSSSAVSYCFEFTDTPGQVISECDQVIEGILERTQKNINIVAKHRHSPTGDETENGTGTVPFVSPIPIILKISSSKLIDLTLIDLPGLIRVPTTNQPQDIDEQIKKIVLQYISSPNCVILAVSAANVDLANSDSLRIAREVDPFGSRTIGVLTKSDLVDDPEVLLSIVEGRIYPLQKGYILVKCRSGKEGDKVDIENSLAIEGDFFRSHPHFSLLKEQSGITYLAHRLSETLLNHIKAHLPRIMSRVEHSLNQTRVELKVLGGDVESLPDASSGAVLLKVFTRFSRMVDDLLDGRVIISEKWHNRNDSVSNGAVELIGGARLHFIFNDWFASSIMQLNPLSGLTNKEIHTAIRNAAGSSTSLFVPETAFEMLVRKQIRILEQPALQCVNQALVELTNIVDYPLSFIPEFKQYAQLEQRVKNLCRNVVTKHLTTTLKYVADFIRIELAFINKSHPDFFNGRRVFNSYFATCNRRNIDGTNINGLRNPNGTCELENSASALTPVPGSINATESDEARAGQPMPGSHAQSFLTFWRRHPLQQTPAPLILHSRSSGTGGPLSTNPRKIPCSPMERGALTTRGSLPVREIFNPTIELAGPLTDVEAIECDNKEGSSLEVDLVKTLICSYFEIVKKTLSDVVPKCIMHFLVNASRDDLHKELVGELYKPELFGELLEEAPDIPELRSKLKKRLGWVRDHLAFFCNPCLSSILNEASDILRQMKIAKFP